MNSNRTKLKWSFSVSLLLSVLLMTAPPGLCVSKETLQMMQQLDTLTQMVQSLQKTLDTQTAVMRTLIEQANDNVNSMKATIEALRKSNEGTLASSNARFDSMTNQIQALSESLDEAKARLAKLSDQVTQTQTIIQTLNTPPQPAVAPGTSTPGTTPGQPPAKPAIPDADTLYQSGLSAYNGGQFDLAVQSFQEYLQYYGDSDLAANAQFFIGDCYYNQKNYSRAVEEYNKCLERYPKGNKLPAAQLKKGYALLAMDDKRAGEAELRSLVQRYPGTHEAALATQRLRQLGIVLRRSQ